MFSEKFDLTDGGSHSGHGIYRDEDIYVAICFESAALSQRRKLISVTFNKLGIDVISYDLVDLALQFSKDSSKKEEFTNGVLALVKMDCDTLNGIAKAAYDNGYRDGQHELKATIRGLLGVAE